MSNGGNLLFSGDYINPSEPWWAFAMSNNAAAENLQVSTLTVNPYPAGNILLQSQNVDGIDYNAPIIFQRPAGDPLGGSASFVMNTSLNVPTIPFDGAVITATGNFGTVYDDIAVEGVQIFGQQTTSGNAGAAGYITGIGSNIVIASAGLYVSSLYASTVTVGTVVSTTSGTANTYTASLYMSTPVLYTSTLFAKSLISTNGINNTSGDIVCNPGNIFVNGTNALIRVGPGGFTPSAFLTRSNLLIGSVTATQGTFANETTTSISSVTISTSLITAALGTFSTMNTSNLSTNSVNSSNISTNNLNVSSISRLNDLSVFGASFYYGNLTGLDPDRTLLWNGSIIANSTIVTPSIYMDNTPTPGGAGYITANGLPFGIDIKSDSFQVLSYTSSPYTAIATSSSNIVTQNLIEQNKFVTPAVSTNIISTNNLYAGQTFVTTENVSTVNASVVNVSSINISTAQIGKFVANEVDVNTLSSITSRVSFALTSTLQLKADVAVSPNINLGLGDVIQGLIGGASAQGLAVGVGTVGLATGATALVTGRQSGGVDNTVFQTVNGSTQLQFSTIGITTPSVFLTTDSADPLHTPGNLSSQTITVAPGTYCVRSVGDPLNIDSATQGIQMFGQWIPVIQPTATFPIVRASTIAASTMTARQASISSLTVSSLNFNLNFPSTIAASTITYNGALTGTNPIAPLTWPGLATFQSTQLNQIQFVNNLGAASGRVYGASEFGQGINMIATAGFTIQNSNNAIARFNQDQTMTVFSTLTVYDMKCQNNLWVSTITASTINAVVTPVFPSSLATSTLTITGNIDGTNTNGSINWTGSAQITDAVNSQGLGILNTTLTPVGIIRAGLDNNVIFDMNALTFRTGGGANNFSTLALTPTGNVNIISTLNSRFITTNLLQLGTSLTGKPYLSSTTTSGEEQGIFYGGSTMSLKADSVVRVEMGSEGSSTQNPLIFSLFSNDTPQQAVAIQLQGGPMTFAGSGIEGLGNLATFNLNAQFNRSTIMRGAYNAASTFTVSTLSATNFTNRIASISSLTVSSINTVNNTPIGVPAGGIITWAGGNAFAPNIPLGWLLCDGSQYSQTTYPDLYAAIGTTYERFLPNAGNFFVPDLRFTFPMSAPSYGPGPAGMVNPPSGTAYSEPTNLGYPGVLPNQIWRFTALKNGVLVPGMTFAGRGPGGAAAFIDRMIDGNGDIGSYIMSSLSVGSWPVLGSVGAPVLVTPINIGTGANYPYKIGTYNDSGYNANPNSNTQIYNWGRNITGSNVGVRNSTSNTFGGVMNTYSTPVVVGGLALETAPNFINMFMIIKY